MPHQHAPVTADYSGSNDMGSVLRHIGLGFALVTGAVMISPHLLPLIGIGDMAIAEEATTALHAIDIGSGVAGGINRIVNAIPGIGPTLAEGGLKTAAAVAAIGLGGTLLSNFLKKEGGDGKRFSLSNMIHYAALATSALIALPTALTSLSLGIVYLCATFGGEQAYDMASNAVTLLSNTIGATGSMQTSYLGVGSLAVALPHIIGCGASMLPAALSIKTWRDKRKQQAEQENAFSSLPKDPLGLQLELQTDCPIVKNQTIKATLKIIDSESGQPLDVRDLAVTHTEKLHLFVIDQSLKDYQHIHPQPTGIPGEFSFTFTPRTSNSYHVFADITTEKDHENHKLFAEIPSLTSPRAWPRIPTNDAAYADGLQFHWKSSQPLHQGEPATVEVSITDANGKIFNQLEPVMGAYAHLVGFSADGTSMLHCHPLGKEPVSTNERGNGKLQFHIVPETVGGAQFYLQVKKDGHDIFVPFGQYIAPSKLATNRLRYGNKSENSHEHYEGLAYR